MKTQTVILALLTASLAGAQSSPPAPQSRVAGRFVAYNYGLWFTNPTSIQPGTGSQTFTVNLQFVTLPDGRQIVPWNTNSPIYVGTEKVTPSAVANCSIGDTRPGICSITATFAVSHTVVDTVSPATFGLQEALNDAGASGGGAVTIDSAWALLGGTTVIKNAATLPANTGIEDVRTGAPAGSGITALTGDVTATGPGSAAASVVKVNGAAVPASQGCVGTNGSSQIIAGSCGGAATATAQPQVPVYFTAGSNTLTPSSTVPSQVTAQPLNSNSLAPLHYNPPVITSSNGLYIPILSTSAVTTAGGTCSNISNSGGADGIVATTGGVSGSCTITLPFDLDPTKEKKIAVYVQDNETSTPTTRVDFINRNSINVFTLLIAASGNINGYINGAGIASGTLTSVPAGTNAWYTVNGDGVSFTAGIWPDQAHIADLNQATVLNAAWNNVPYIGQVGIQTIDNTNGAIYNGINTIKITTSSALNIVKGICIIEGTQICGPADGSFPAPGAMYVQTGEQINPTTTSASAGGNLGLGNPIWLPYNYGSPQGNPTLFFYHQNAGYSITTPTTTTLAKALTDGYIVAAETGNFNAACSNGSDALCNPFGAKAGSLMRKEVQDYILKHYPSTGQRMALGQSMGCIQALNDEYYTPGFAAIVCVSGFTSLVNGWTPPGGFTSYAANIKNGYGDFYTNILAGTGHTPASSPTFWAKISSSPDAPGQGNLNFPNYNWKATYNPATAYVARDVVSVDLTGGSFPAALNLYDPLQHPERYRNVPLYMAFCNPADSPGDTTLDPTTQSIAFATAVVAAGGTVTSVDPVNNACGHITADQFDPTAMVAFLDTYRVTNPVNANGAPAALGTAAPAFPATNLPSQTLTLAADSSQSSTAAKTLLSWPIGKLQVAKVTCHLIYQVAGTNDKPVISITGPSLSGTPNGAAAGYARMQVAIAAGVPTDNVVNTTSSTTYPTFTPAANAGASATSYAADVVFDVANSSTAGTLSVQFAESAGLSAITIKAKSACTFFPSL